MSQCSDAGCDAAVVIAATPLARVEVFPHLLFRARTLRGSLCGRASGQRRACGEVVDELVQREHAEGDLVVGRPGAALEQAGEGHDRRDPRGRGQLQVGQVRVGAGALVDHPGPRPAVRVAGEQAEENPQVLAGIGPRWVGVHHPGRGEEVFGGLARTRRHGDRRGPRAIGRRRRPADVCCG